jgi:outer membrane protein insertion porin family
MLKKHLLYLLMCAPLFLSLPDLRTAGYDGLKITKITFEGDQNTRKDLLRSAITIKIGDSYLASKITESTKELFRLGLFSDIRVDVRKSGDKSGVEVVFLLTEYPLVKTVEYQGMKKVSSTDLEEEVKKLLPENEVYTPARSRQVMDLILSKYREEGYLFTSITVEEKPDKKGLMTIVFKVDEGAKTIVRKIRIKGNAAFAEKKLLSRMETKAKDWLHGGVFDPFKYEADLEKILSYYKDNGYIRARLVRDTITTNVVVKAKKRSRTETRELQIDIAIEEGVQYVFDGYGALEGVALFSTNEIRKSLKQKKDTVFNQSKFIQDIMGVQQMYAGRGYIFCQVIPQETMDETNRRIGFTISVYEGEIAHVESIVIKGNVKTKEYVIRRELSVREGDIFDADKIRRSREKIFNLGFFKNVDVDTRPGSAEGLMTLVIEVEEQPTGMITMGATLSGSGASFQPGGYEEVSENNFLGRGYRIKERVAINTTEYSGNAEFSTPWIFQTPTSLSASVYYSHTKLDYSNRNFKNTNNVYYKMDTGVMFGLGRRINDYMKVNGSYNFQYYEHFRIGKNVPEDQIKNGGFFRNLIQTSFEYDSRDNIFDATRGFYFRQGFETSFGFNRNDLYNKYITDASFYQKTFWKLVLVFHGYLGIVGNSFWSPDYMDVNVRDQFYLGSVDTIRGYQQSGFKPWGVSYGNTVNYFNIEYRAPIVDQVLGAVAFLDAGNLSSRSLWDMKSSAALDPRSYACSVGTGLRLQIPMMPLRFYFSWPWGYTEKKGWHFYDKQVQIDFSVGGMF